MSERFKLLFEKPMDRGGWQCYQRNAKMGLSLASHSETNHAHCVLHVVRWLPHICPLLGQSEDPPKRKAHH